MNKWHIFAGGDLGDTSFITINKGDTVICADSGLIHAEKMGLIPDIIVGDFDSYEGTLPDSAEVHRSIPEKDDTDTLLAVRLAISRGADEIVIYGALGGRFDHSVANVQTLKFALDHGCRAVLADDRNLVMLAKEGTHTFERREGWYVSLFSYGECVKIGHWSGVKYPLDDAELTNAFPLGVSNEVTGSESVLKITRGAALIVCSKR